MWVSRSDTRRTHISIILFPHLWRLATRLDIHMAYDLSSSRSGIRMMTRPTLWIWHMSRIWVCGALISQGTFEQPQIIVRTLILFTITDYLSLRFRVSTWRVCVLCSGLPPALGMPKACFRKKNLISLKKFGFIFKLCDKRRPSGGWPCTFRGLGFPVSFFYRPNNFSSGCSRTP